MNPLDTATAEGIYDILVEFCGATESGRESFVLTQTAKEMQPVHEYRFIGSLGFDGKFWRNDAWYVNYNPEDDTEERRCATLDANAALEVLATTTGHPDYRSF